jgi:hypothetical protein
MSGEFSLTPPTQKNGTTMSYEGGNNSKESLSPRRRAESRLPTGFRVVHVPVPESIFNHAKANAYLSGLRFAVFVATVLKDSKPIDSNRPSSLEQR